MTRVRPDKKFFLLACLALALGTLALYWPATGCPFTTFDDASYITDNPTVKAGLTWPGLVWAFNGMHVANWHPLTWISHMADCQFFGLNAGGHHLVNVLFHTANSLLLFAFLRYSTKAEWRSAIVAALFAWHPLHVESVVWISERKDVLSTFFWLLTLLAYARHAQSPEAGSQKPAASNPAHQPPPITLNYFLALFFFACGLMSKPMVVTLPFVLLLLDWWPLDRFQISNFKSQIFIRLIAEKIPFFLLSCAFCALTFLAQRSDGAVCPVSWSARLENVPMAYVRYLSKTFWPENLSIYYPYVYDWPVVAVAGSILLLLVISTLALLRFRQQAWLATGWFWFLGTLVPVIGLVQAGMQAMADRYSYIPSIGLFIVVVWGVAEYCAEKAKGKRLLALIGGGAVAGCLLAASGQISHWQSNVRLFTHAVDIDPDNFVALNGLGCAFNEAGRPAEALQAFRKSVRLGPNYWPSERNLALTLLNNHQPEEAFTEFATVTRLLPNDASLRYELSLYLLKYGHIEAAKGQLVAAVQIKPDFSQAHELLGAVHLRQTNLTEAIPQFSLALAIDPADAEAHFNLGLALEQQGKSAEAAAQFRTALRLIPDSALIKQSLGQILAAHPELKFQP